MIFILAILLAAPSTNILAQEQAEPEVQATPAAPASPAAQATPGPRGAGAPAAQAPAEPREPPPAITRHSIEIGGKTLAYTATVGMIPLADQSDVVKARMYYTSYVLDGADKQTRPVTFAFNGGPGSASAYLHLGGLGPKAVVAGDDGAIVVPLPQLAANPLTWLVFTDLVFIDPIGTGFSRPAMVEGKPVPNKEFWGVGEDVTWTARFMRQYLNRAQRWSSPKYVAGESYGGFRAARLAETAQTQFGVALNGVIMISPIIEYSTSRYSRYAFLPAVLQLPTFAAVAWYHGKIDGATADPAARDRLLAEVEAYSVSDALTALAQGDGLPLAQRDALYDKLARYTGLSIDAVRRFNGRIWRDLYVKELLAKSGRVLGIYDASVTMEDPDPASPFFRDADPTSQRLTAPLLTALNAYLRDELKVTTNSSYILSNSQANNGWEWGRGRSDGSADALRAGMI
ncbi:MAG: peptidase S10, partial [Proteobacteria bacterium]|nr:peptidase S10 [Pseudomonadota bacterium]